MFLLQAFVPGYPTLGQEGQVGEVREVVTSIAGEHLIGLAFGMRTD